MVAATSSLAPPDPLTTNAGGLAGRARPGMGVTRAADRHGLLTNPRLHRAINNGRAAGIRHGCPGILWRRVWTGFKGRESRPALGKAANPAALSPCPHMPGAGAGGGLSAVIHGYQSPALLAPPDPTCSAPRPGHGKPIEHVPEPTFEHRVRVGKILGFENDPGEQRILTRLNDLAHIGRDPCPKLFLSQAAAALRLLLGKLG